MVKDIYVIRNTKRDYDCYWNTSKNTWIGLLEADMHETKDIAVPVDREVVSYNKVIGTSK